MRQVGIDPAVGEWLMSRGVQPKDLLSQAQGSTVGNFLSAQDATKYKALMGLDDKQVNEDLTSKGVTDRFFNSDAAKIKAAADAKKLQDSLNQEVKFQQMMREREANILMNNIRDGVYNKSVGAATGLSQDDFNFARANGIDLTQGNRTGAALQVGDVANDLQRQKWSQLKAVLGIQDDFNPQDLQDEGKAFSYDAGNVLSSVGQLRAQQAAAAAEAERQRQEAERAAAQAAAVRAAREAAMAEDQRKAEAERQRIESAPTDLDNPGRSGTVDARGSVVGKKLTQFGNWISGK
jgi:hypothetical protein